MLRSALLIASLSGCASVGVFDAVDPTAALRRGAAQSLSGCLHLSLSVVEESGCYRASEARCVRLGQERACAEDDLYIDPGQFSAWRTGRTH